MNDELNLNSTHGCDLHNIVKNYDKSEDRKEYYKKIKSINKFSDLMERDQRRFLSNTSINIEVISGDDKEIKEYFTVVQNQEKVKAGEITSNLEMINIEESFNYEKLDEILIKIGFNNKRKEMVKILIADYGYQNSLISLGTTDEKVIAFAKKIDQENDPIIVEELKKHIENSISFLMRLDAEEFSTIKGPAKKRFIKIFLLMINKLKPHSYINIGKINFINSKLSEYNGKTARTNPKVFKEKLIEEFSEIKLEDYSNFENLFYLFQGSNNIDDVANKKLISF